VEHGDLRMKTMLLEAEILQEVAQKAATLDQHLPTKVDHRKDPALHQRCLPPMRVHRIEEGSAQLTSLAIPLAQC
jgi:hypothetical protein